MNERHIPSILITAREWAFMSGRAASDMSEAPDKPEDQESDRPQRDEEEPQRRKVSRDELRRILEAHEKWAQSDGKEGEQADLCLADLHEAYPSHANLEEADLRGANLQQASLYGANLQEANLTSANLQGADLSGAKLQGAKLWAAKLQRAILWSADLQKADLSGANLQGTELRSAKGLTQEQLDQACGDTETKLPPNLSIKPCPEESK